MIKTAEDFEVCFLIATGTIPSGCFYVFFVCIMGRKLHIGSYFYDNNLLEKNFVTCTLV